MEETDIAFQLKSVFEKELEEKGLTELYTDIEIPLLKVLAKMEIEGINLNTDYLKELSEVITKDIEELENADQRLGANVIVSSVFAPLKQILDNANMSSDLVINNLLQMEDENIGLNVRTGKFENLIEVGIVDPVKVTKTALINAASAAGTLLTTNCAVLRESVGNNDS